ncbi:hypothetical protein [Spongiimicrobium sp. 3-5]|uniref:hypothetical protein n=1 Tax=Spongiimicrobium sp. 3-5 TaxID=3332596 RepID=UPI0039816ADF
MEENKDIKFDEFLKTAVKEAGLEQPPQELSAAVMRKIIKANTSARVTTYRPLISKTYWAVFALAVFGLFTYFFFGDYKNIEIGSLSLDIDKLVPSRFFELIGTVEVSNTFVYGVLGLTFFVGVQVLILKRYLDKRFLSFH